jgi:hypothetical protein
MVNNSANINKTYNDLLTFSLNTKKTTTCDIGNPGPGLGQAQKCGEVKPVSMFLINIQEMNFIADQNQYNLSPDAGKKHVLFPLIYSSCLIQYIYENRQF